MQPVRARLKSWARLLAEAAAPRRPALAWPLDARRDAVPLGDGAVHVLDWQAGAGGLCYVNVHEDEKTSVQAALAVLSDMPGRLVGLQAGGRRLVRFRLGWRPVVFDPNRIFTDAGLAATLARHAGDTPAARRAVGALRDALLARLDGPADRPLVALHNLRGGAYDARVYAPGGPHAGDARRVALAPGQSPQDFLLVTHAPHFEALAGAGFNVVLQDEAPRDDGSLSVWCQRQGRAYVNVEAGLGRLDAQQAMLRAVAALA